MIDAFKRRGRKSLLWVVLPAALLGVMALGSSSAQAYTQHDLGNVFLQPTGHPSYWEANLWSSNMTGTISLYEGSGTAALCARLISVELAEERQSCGVNGAGAANWAQSLGWYGLVLKPGLRNSGSYAHTFHVLWFSP